MTPAVPTSSPSRPLRILMLDYSAYDTAYADKMQRLIKGQLPACTVSEFWEGSVYDLNSALAIHNVVVLTYPSSGNPEVNKTYGKLLTQYVRQGGTVIVTGTDDYHVLQQFGLFEVEFGYFCQDPLIQETAPEHPILEGTTDRFSLNDYVYPLDISDPDFVSLVNVLGLEDENSSTRCWSETDEVAPAELRSFPVIGFKNIGAGKVVYLGMEYYYEQPEPARILANVLRWITPSKTTPVVAANAARQARLERPVRRTEEVLQAGSGLKADVFDLKIYPNPYFEKAILDIELKKASTLSVEMTDEKGRIAAVVLPQKSLNPGMYRLDLPNVAPGVYFVQCKTGEKVTTRRVVKVSAQ